VNIYEIKNYVLHSDFLFSHRKNRAILWISAKYSTNFERKHHDEIRPYALPFCIITSTVLIALGRVWRLVHQWIVNGIYQLIRSKCKWFNLLIQFFISDTPKK